LIWCYSRSLYSCGMCISCSPPVFRYVSDQILTLSMRSAAWQSCNAMSSGWQHQPL